MILIKRKNHLLFNTLILIPLGILLYYYILDSTILVVMIYLSIPIGALFPDLDLTFTKKYHRHWLFHSIIFTGVCWVLCLQYPEFMLFVALLNFSVGLHLLEDISFRVKGGTYCVKLYKKYDFKKKMWLIKGLNYKKSSIWFLVNFLVSLGILAYTCLAFF